jgi:hypothetical protein
MFVYLYCILGPAISDGEWYLDTKTWVLGVTIVTEVALLLGPFNRDFMWTYIILIV